jgi:transcriptional regulator with XRE-family HTH domain
MTLGQKIKYLRKEKNITQEELAKNLNVIRGTLSNWEIDKATPDIQTCKNIASFFGVSLDVLLDNGDGRRQSAPYSIVKEASKTYGEKHINSPSRPAPDPREIIAAHRTDDDYRKGLPPEAIEEIEMYLDYIRHKYRKKQQPDGNK